MLGSLKKSPTAAMATIHQSEKTRLREKSNWSRWLLSKMIADDPAFCLRGRVAYPGVIQLRFLAIPFEKQFGLPSGCRGGFSGRVCARHLSSILVRKHRCVVRHW